jgi:hypothetical protein
VKVEDVPRVDPKQGKFAEDCRGRGEHPSFQYVLCGKMTGRGNCGRGRGRGGRFDEEQWGGPPG